MPTNTEPEQTTEQLKALCAELMQENTILRQHAAKLISDGTLLKSLSVAQGLHMQLEGGVVQVLAEAFVEQFTKSGATNFLELQFEAPALGQDEHLVVTVQRVSGLTPAALLAQAQSEIAQLKLVAGNNPTT